MNITAFKERDNCTETIAFSGKTVQEFLQQIKVNPETVIVVRNNEVITEQETLHDNDKIELLSVISGG